jgi:GNAT superfamily N-acetyltransferase
MLRPVFRAGETYCVPRDIGAEAALAMWFGPGYRVFLAEDAGVALGTYNIHPNRDGGGAHVANCSFVTAQQAQGRGVARTMAAHAIDTGRALGFRAIQFNFVVSSNARAIAVWQGAGWQVVGRLPEAFLHPKLGYVDALVMFRRL